MHWYDRLNQYFPVEEMKSRTHVETLLTERPDIYHIDQSDTHVLLYVEADDYVFVDYLLVTSAARGQGLGRKLLDRLKAKGKPILLEVEPEDYEDTDTVKRQRFYRREGFRHAEAVVYRRRSLATSRVNELEILFWTPAPDVSDAEIFASMRHVYEQVHTWRDREFYGEAYQHVDEAVRLMAPRGSRSQTSAPQAR